MWRKKDEKNVYLVKKKILILAANPKNTDPLRFGEEVSKIKKRLRISKYRDQFEIYSELAIDYDALRFALLDNNPQIVHFIGHGNEKGIALEDEIGFTELISTDKLSELFELFSNHVECVILNACYSDTQADAINRYIPYVIGMQKEVGDKASIEFAKGFYDGIGAGKSVEVAYRLGCNAVRDHPEPLNPVLKKKKGLKKEGTLEKSPQPPPPPTPELLIYLLFISIGLTFEVLYSFFKINLSQSFIMLCRAFYIGYIPTAIHIIIKGPFRKRKKSEEERQQKKQEPRSSRTNRVSLPERIRTYRDTMNIKQILLPVFIAFALFVSLVVLDFNKPITIYWHELSGDIEYLKYANSGGDPEIDFNSKGNKVSLTSKKWNTSIFWIKFKNYSINWDEYDKIYLKIDHSDKTGFDQSAMLKLRLNNTTLSPINGKVKQVGTKEEDKFLIESRGSFYYHLKSSDLDQDNEITITLNRGKWMNFCIELALIKQ